MITQRNTILITFVLAIVAAAPAAFSQHSVARQWNEVLLEAIRDDFARPTVHARNLYHTSAAMYDIWATYDNVATTVFLGRTVDGFNIPFAGVPGPNDLTAARNEAISYAAYRLLSHRFRESPGAAESLTRFDSLMVELGYDANVNDVDYESGNPAALGNYVAEQMIAFGLQDGANEQADYANKHYQPANPPIIPALPGAPTLVYPNRWQPLSLKLFIDQAGNPVPGDTVQFLSPEWGIVTPFALSGMDLTVYSRHGGEYWVYHDPGLPPQLDATLPSGLEDDYKWGFALVSVWSAHLDPADSVLWDISPGTIGNIESFPQDFADYRQFFNLLDGGDPGRGHAVNPRTGAPYDPQFVPRGDYARVLAEFWADGPDSETPPGHWFTILNYVTDHPDFEGRFKGDGERLEPLEWDVKAYLALGGAMHDAAVAAWGIKGWYDYLRPISAIRSMAGRGQSSDPFAPRYHTGGIPLIKGFIELVDEDDPLAGVNGEHVNKIKLYAWRGPDFILIPEIDVAGVGWILAEDWWPYQRPTFVTPPFAGYISGHSTFSRAAAEVLTLLTGDPFFPGGLGEFVAKKDEFLVFEDGPSVDVRLQWATYRDASDQTSLSRIWGGIHPPADDLPGRIIGERIGIDAFNRAEQYFQGQATSVRDVPAVDAAPVATAYPNPLRQGDVLQIEVTRSSEINELRLFNVLGQVVRSHSLQPGTGTERVAMETKTLATGLYLLRASNGRRFSTSRVLILR